MEISNFEEIQVEFMQRVTKAIYAETVHRFQKKSDVIFLSLKETQ